MSTVHSKPGISMPDRLGVFLISKALLKDLNSFVLLCHEIRYNTVGIFLFIFCSYCLVFGPLLHSTVVSHLKEAGRFYCCATAEMCGTHSAHLWNAAAGDIIDSSFHLNITFDSPD